METDVLSILAIDGTYDADKLADLDEDRILDMYRLLNLTRIWNEKVCNGRIVWVRCRR